MRWDEMRWDDPSEWASNTRLRRIFKGRRTSAALSYLTLHNFGYKWDLVCSSSPGTVCRISFRRIVFFLGEGGGGAWGREGGGGHPLTTHKQRHFSFSFVWTWIDVSPFFQVEQPQQPPPQILIEWLNHHANFLAEQDTHATYHTHKRTGLKPHIRSGIMAICSCCSVPRDDEVTANFATSQRAVTQILIQLSPWNSSWLSHHCCITTPKI